MVKILQAVIDGRRERKEKNFAEEKKDMMGLLLDVEDENGTKLDDEEIIDVILMYLNAGYESTAHATLWAILFLHQNPQYFHVAKVSQDEDTLCNSVLYFLFSSLSYSMRIRVDCRLQVRIYLTHFLTLLIDLG